MSRNGRPAKAETERRDYQVGLRFNVEEADRVKQLASICGMKSAAFVRAAALGFRPKAVVPEVNRKAWADLAPLANNLNQIARQINSGERGANDLAGTVETLLEAVQSLRRDLLGATVEEGHQ